MHWADYKKNQRDGDTVLRLKTKQLQKASERLSLVHSHDVLDVKEQSQYAKINVSPANSRLS